jgi:hypothetical protein
MCYDPRMKIDDREDALSVARSLVGAQPEEIADALLSAHLEGVNMGRACLGKLVQGGAPLNAVVQELDGRKDFILSQMSERLSSTT